MTSSSVERLARNGSLNVAGTVVGGGAGIALVVLVTNGVHQDLAGMLFATTSFFLIVSALSALGTDAGLAHAIQRQLAAGSAAGALTTVGIALRAVVGVSIALAGAMWFAAPWLGGIVSHGADPVAMTAMLQVLALVLPVATAYDTVLGATLAYGTTQPNVVVEKLGRLPVQILCVLGAILLGAGPVGLAVAWSAPYVLGLVTVGWWCRRLVRSGDGVVAGMAGGVVAGAVTVVGQGEVVGVVGNEHDGVVASPSGTEDSLVTGRGNPPGPPGGASGHPSSGPDLSRAELSRMFWAFTAPRALGRICQVALQRTDIVLIAVLLSAKDAAIYTAATRFLAFGQLGIAAIQQVLAPQLSGLFARDDLRGVRAVFSASTAWLMSMAWPIYLTSAIAAPVLLRVFGGGYQDGHATVVILSLIMLATTATGSVDVVLLMAGRSRQSLVNNAAALVVDVVLVVVLVPRLGITGAALAWAAALAVRNLLPMLQVRRAFGIWSFGPAAAWVAASAGVCFGVAPLLLGVVVPMTVPVLVIWLPLMCVAYAALLWRGRTTLELGAFRSALPKLSASRRTKRLPASSVSPRASG